MSIVRFISLGLFNLMRVFCTRVYKKVVFSTCKTYPAPHVQVKKTCYFDDTNQNSMRQFGD